MDFNYNVGDIVEFSFIDEDNLLVHGKGKLGVRMADYPKMDFSISNVEYFQDNECEYSSLNIKNTDIVRVYNGLENISNEDLLDMYREHIEVIHYWVGEEPTFEYDFDTIINEVERRMKTGFNM